MKQAPHHWIFLVPCGLMMALPASASFTNVSANLAPVTKGAVAWGDYDNDGDLDLVITGFNTGGPVAAIYRNTAGVFADAGAIPTTAGVYESAVAWGDYDNDGDLDLALAGFTGTVAVTRIYRNDGGTFTDLGLGLEGLRNGAVSWADFDNDGDLDLATAGSNGSTGAAHLYRNTAGSFAEVTTSIAGVADCAVAWADYDSDGDLDLLIAGSTTTLYRNASGAFTAVTSALPNVSGGSAAWGDYDNDRDPDVLISGFPATGGPFTRIYRNTAGAFANIGASLASVFQCSVGWGDCDNDGDLDVAVSGSSASVSFSSIAANNAGIFSDISAGLPGLSFTALAWGDFDNDGDLDLLLTGSLDGLAGDVTRIYRNSGPTPDTPPTAPTGLNVTSDASTVTFHWNASTDVQGGALGLSYNLWVGAAPGTPTIMPAMANLTTGYRRVVQLGNVGQNLQWTLPLSVVTGRNIYWGVQAIDQAFAGSLFATGPLLTLGVAADAPRPGLELRLEGTNPISSEAHLQYFLPRASRVHLDIYDLVGRRLRDLLDADLPAGHHEARWDGRDDGGSGCAPGLYFARLRAAGATTSLRLLKFE